MKKFSKVDPIRVLYLIERLAHGGSEKQLMALIRGLQATRLVAPHLAVLQPDNGIDVALDVPRFTFGKGRLFSPATAVRLRALAAFCRTHRIDVLQTFFQDPTLIGALLKIVRPVRLVVSFRDLGFWRNGVENLKMRAAYLAADGFLANSRAVKKHFTETDGIDPLKITVIYNGIAEARIARVPTMPTAAATAVVGIVGNFNRAVKRMGDFIEAAAVIKKRYANVRFVIVGDGHQKDALVRRCRALAIDDVVRFTGRVADPAAWMREFSIGVNTSESEGFSNAVLEYMGCGLPVVVTDVGGNREMVAQGINGYRVPVGDREALAASVVALLQNPSLRLRMGQDNIDTVRRKYSMDQMIDAHVVYYNHLVTR